jgi:hypothetical protein
MVLKVERGKKKNWFCRKGGKSNEEVNWTSFILKSYVGFGLMK